ncbi:MAG: TRAP transporter substrate-binding protein [Candidatus Xenobia bacterium]
MLLIGLLARPALAVPTLHLLYVDPAGSPIDQGAQCFKREVERRSHGGLRVELFCSGAWEGQSLSELEILQQVVRGEVDACIVTTAPLGNYSRQLQVLDMPFLFRDYGHVYRVLDGPIGRSLLDSLRSRGLHGLAFMDSGFRIFTSSRPISRLADFRGLRVRVMQNDIYNSFLKLIGATPVPAPVNKVNFMASHGYIDAADRSYPTYWEFGLYRFERCTLESHHAYAAEAFLLNEIAWQRLSPSERDVVAAAAREARDAQRRAFLSNENQVKQRCQRAGIAITHLSPADAEAMRAACRPLYDSLRGEFGELLDRIQATP